MSMRILITVLLFCCPFVAPLGVQTAAVAAEKDKAPVTDDSVRDQVMMRLAGDTEVKGGGIDVAVTDGAVTLKGVKSVTNQLTIRQ